MLVEDKKVHSLDGSTEFRSLHNTDVKKIQLILHNVVKFAISYHKTTVLIKNYFHFPPPPQERQDCDYAFKQRR